MSAQGEDLLAWLETAIALREKHATLAAVSKAGSSNGGRWNQRRDEHHGGYMVRRPALRPGATTPPLTDAVPERVALVLGESEAAHIVANDPESVLRRCAADRKLLASHQPVPGVGFEPDDDHTPGAYGEIASACSSCGKADEYAVRFPCHVVLTLAEGYGWTGGER